MDIWIQVKKGYEQTVNKYVVLCVSNDENKQAQSTIAMKYSESTVSLIVIIVKNSSG